jgi:hypothetical protein
VEDLLITISYIIPKKSIVYKPHFAEKTCFVKNGNKAKKVAISDIFVIMKWI